MRWELNGDLGGSSLAMKMRNDHFICCREIRGGKLCWRRDFDTLDVGLDGCLQLQDGRASALLLRN